MGCGASVKVEGDDSILPIHVAAFNGEVDEVRRLLIHGADVNGVDARGRTPLHYARCHRAGIASERCAWLLLEWGADEGRKDHDGRTPLDVRIQHARWTVSRL